MKKITAKELTPGTYIYDCDLGCGTAEAVTPEEDRVHIVLRVQQGRRGAEEGFTTEGFVGPDSVIEVDE
jgi:hypothetical protein